LRWTKIKLSLRFVENLVNFMRSPARYLDTFGYFPSTRERGLFVIMCGYNEQENIMLALESLEGKVDGVIFIDKNGALEKIVKLYTSVIKIDYEIRSDLNLRESRMYALTKIPSFAWVLIVDADERLLLSKNDLMKLMVRKVCYRTKMNVIMNELGEVDQNDFHNFLMYNDGSIFFREGRDVPRFDGRHINLDIVAKENRSWCKSKRHLYYRFMFWKDWQYSKLRAGPIEYYIKTVGERPSDEKVAAWYEEFKQEQAARIETE